MVVPEQDVIFAFGMSKMAITSEPADYKKYNVMTFVEFLEFVGRLSEAKFKNCSDSTRTLCWKIE
jgi:hypothetical protein